MPRHELGGPGPGRPKGQPNRVTAVLKDAMLQAFEKAGGVEYLVRVSQEDPRTFCGLIGRLLPQEVRAEVSNDFQDKLAERLKLAVERAKNRNITHDSSRAAAT